jgi:hypothetical protein
VVVVRLALTSGGGMDREVYLAMLRRGFKHLNACFDLCQFKPSSA